MDTWFKKQFGFQEGDYNSTREKLLESYDLTEHTLANQKIGDFSIPSLQELRNATSDTYEITRGTITFENIIDDALSLHLDPQNEGATFQVASQFNLLEFPAPDALPELGVTDYVYDRTQGPTCAMACPAGAVFRNYLVPMSDNTRGQREDLQINTLAELESQLDEDYWTVQNGYIESTEPKLRALNTNLSGLSENERERLKSLIHVGAHTGIQVVDSKHTVNQVFASAVSAGYSSVDRELWEPLARLVLESAYESTLLIALLSNRERIAHGLPARPVYLTKLGGGVFRNKPSWIASSMQTAIKNVRATGEALDIKLVHFRHLEIDYSRIK